ncbi:MAG: diguanylate cyclase [Lachnospiraceae bacterium]|nr:diguanylate cyclase [Lachnospiraceae bacterium]
MRFFGLLKKIHYGTFSKNDYKDYKNEINQTNYDLLISCSFYSAIIYFILTIVALNFSLINHAFFVYFISTILLVMMLVMNQMIIKKQQQYATYAIYLLLTIILISNLILGTFLHQKECALSFIVAITVFPILMLDIPKRLFFYKFCMTILFCICSIITKDFNVWIIDCMNAFIFYLTGNFISYHTIRNSMQNITRKAQFQWNDTRYRALLNGTNVITFDFDMEKMEYYISTNSKLYFKINNPYDWLFEGRDVYQEDLEHYRKILDKIIYYGENIDNEIRFQIKTGEIEWFHFYATNLINDVGSRNRIVGKFENINPKKQLEEELKSQAEQDRMTLLFNKTTTENLIKKRMLEKNLGVCALMIIDMDDFKSINDTYGHHIGDRAMISFAQTIKRNFRSTDIVGRIGGDEFMVYLQEMKSKQAIEHKIAFLVEEINTIKVVEDTQTKFLSASIGIALQNEDDNDFNNLYKKADLALYQLKHGGKNGFAFYEENEKYE